MEITQEILKTLTELKNSKCKKERAHAHALLLLNRGRSIQEVAERKTILNESDKYIIEEEIGKYPHQPKIAYAMTLEKRQVKMSYKTFTRFLKKHSI